MQFSILTQRCTVLYCTVQAFNSKSKISWKEHYFKKFLILISLITYLNQSTINATENHFFKQYFKSHFNVQNNTQIAAGSKKLLNLTGCNCIPGNNVYCIGQGNVQISSTNIPITLNGGYIYVEGSLIINRLQEFKGTHLLFGPNASISIANTGLLNINSFAILDICNSPGQGNLAMWQGIIIQSGGQLRLNQTTISNAYQGVEVLPGGLFRQMRKCTFNRNYIGVAMPNGSGQTIGINLENYFTCTDNLLPGYLLPVGITKTWAGIWIQGGAMTMTGSNTYTGLHNAIILEGANVTIRNQIINPMIGGVKYDLFGQTDLYKLTGYGIICMKSSLSNFANNTVTSPTQIAILVIKSSCNIDYNVIDAGIGVEVLSCQNKAIRIGHNKIFFGSLGIYVHESDQIQYLDISVDTLTGANTNTGLTNNTAVRIQGKQGFGSTCSVKHNIISIDKNGEGIYISNFTNNEINNNLITVRAPFLGNIFVNSRDNDGIYVEGGDHHLFLRNIITADASLGNVELSGIRLISGDNSSFCCNTTTGTYYGITIEGDGLKHIIGSNEMSNNYAASFHVNSNTQIGLQNHRANQWPNTSPPGQEAEHEGSERDIDNSLFRVRDDNIFYLPDPILTPNTPTPWQWFIPEAGSEIRNCIACLEERNNNYFFDDGIPTLDDVDRHIVDNSYDFGYFDEGRQWNLQMKVLNMLHTFPSLLGQDSDIDTFYNESFNQAIGIYYQIRQDIRNIYSISNSDRTTLDSLTDLISNNQIELQLNSDLIDQIGIDNDVIFALMDSIQMDLLILHSQYQTLIDQISVNQVFAAGTILNALNSLQAITPTQVIEKRINQLSLKQVVYGYGGLTLSEWQEITDMANTCLHTQRYAVLSARALYTSYTNEVISGEGDCNVVLPLVNFRTSINHPSDVQVYPNPSQSQCTVQWNREDMIVDFKVFTLDGIELLIKTVPINSTSGRVIILNPKSGIYILQMTTQRGKIISKRIILNH
jgi:hypothetical protein